MVRKLLFFTWPRNITHYLWYLQNLIFLKSVQYIKSYGHFKCMMLKNVEFKFFDWEDTLKLSKNIDSSIFLSNVNNCYHYNYVKAKAYAKSFKKRVCYRVLLRSLRLIWRPGLKYNKAMFNPNIVWHSDFLYLGSYYPEKERNNWRIFFLQLWECTSVNFIEI